MAGSQVPQAAEQRDVMQALIGVPMAADFFGRTLTACEFPTGSRAMRMIGSQWARFPLAGGSVYVQSSERGRALAAGHDLLSRRDAPLELAD
jgi:hypothetical protein